MSNSQEIIDFFKNMKICNRYKEDEELSKEDMITILEAGRYAASAFCLEPWKFLVVENNMIKDQLFKFCLGMSKESFSGSYLVVILSRKGEQLNYNSEYVKYILRDIKEIPEDRINVVIDRYKIFLEDEYAMLNNNEKISAWSEKQSYIPLTNMMVAAGKLGISSCPIEGFNKELMEEFLENEALIDRDEFSVSCLVSFGYSKEEQGLRTRRPFDEVVKWI